MIKSSVVCLFAILLIQKVELGLSQKVGDAKTADEAIEKLYKVGNKVRPGIYGPPTDVDIDFYVQSFGALNDIEMQLYVDLDFRQTWKDPRLEFDSDFDTPIYVPYQDVGKFWLPDVYFPNSQKGDEQKLIVPNRSLRIYKTGTVKFFTRLGVTFQCTMNLHKFPHDEQTCNATISTYSYDSNEIRLKWFDNDSIEIKEDEMNMPQMLLDGYKQYDDCKQEYKTGNFSCLLASFKFKRKVGFFILQTYVPSVLIIMLSWLAFWINKNSEPARITIGVTSVLTMTTQLTTSRSNNMRVSYPKAIDVWYTACMIFVFGALLEYALVNISLRSQKRKMSMIETGPRDIEKQHLTEPSGGGSKKLQAVTSRLRRFKKSLNPKDIDQWARILFPGTFLVFFIFYWIFYLVIL